MNWDLQLQQATEAIEDAKRAVGQRAQERRDVIISCVLALGGVSAAAEALGLSRQTVHKYTAQAGLKKTYPVQNAS